MEQELNLTQEQATKVADFLSNNAKPENAVYRYKFFTDNCATRPRDIIEYALGDELEFGEGETSTYRKLVSTCNANYKWNEFGIDLVLGTPADTAIGLREQMFVPMILMDAVGDAKVRRDGTVEPLVRETRVMVDGSDEGDVEAPTPFLLSPMVVGLLLLIIVALMGWRDSRRAKLTRWFASLLFLIAGLAGTVVFYFTFFSIHEATSLNVNVLWLNPLYLFPAVLVWFKGSKSLKVLQWCCCILIALAVLALILFLIGVQHANVAFYPIILALLVQLYMVIRFGNIIVDPFPIF